MLDWIFTADGWIAFVTLFAMEVVLGIDNIVFISILAAKLPRALQARARYIGLGLALLMRIGLLMAITTIIKFTAPLITILGQDFSGRDLVLLLGGLFLIGKATIEIHHMLEGRHEAKQALAATFGMVIAQIVAIDVVFSLDSIITAVGLTNDVSIMVAAVVASMGVMVLSAGPVADFVNRHPTTKMLALAFLVLIGAVLVANGFGVEVPKGYVYAAMVFAVLVEGLNVSARRSRSRRMKGTERPASAVLSEILIKAERQGAAAVQFVADEQGAVKCWMAAGKVLQEDNAACAGLSWSALKSAIAAHVGTPSRADDAAEVVWSAVSPPDARPAALVMLREPA